jgi:hypothetical protein
MLLLLLIIILGVALGLEWSHTQQGLRNPRVLRRPRARCATSPFLLFKHDGGASATGSLLLLLFFGLCQQRFSFTARQNNLKKTEHSILLSASELLHQLMYSTLATGPMGSSATVSMTFGSTSANKGEDNHAKKNAPSGPMLMDAVKSGIGMASVHFSSGAQEVTACPS